MSGTRIHTYFITYMRFVRAIDLRVLFTFFFVSISIASLAYPHSAPVERKCYTYKHMLYIQARRDAPQLLHVIYICFTCVYTEGHFLASLWHGELPRPFLSIVPLYVSVICGGTLLGLHIF